MSESRQTSPDVSVVMNVRDGAEFVHEALDSVHAQTLTNFEFVIVDDGSADGTWEILSAYAAKDSRIVLLRNDVNEGIYKAANKGVRAARAPYIARIDADDIALPRRLELQKAYLDRRQDVAMVSTNWLWESPKRTAPEPSNLSESEILAAWFLLFYNHFCNQSALMFRRDAMLAIGGYNERLPVAADYELWVRLSRAHRLGMIPEYLVRCRRDLPGGITVNRSAEQRHVVNLVSGRAISLVTNGSIESFPTQDFQSFWPTYWKRPYPAPAKAEEFHRRLVPVYRAFVDYWRQRYPADHEEADRLVRASVADAFMHWADSIALADPAGSAHVRSWAERWQTMMAGAGTY